MNYLFAQISDTSVVTWVILISKENCGNSIYPDSEVIGCEFIKSLGHTGTWLQVGEDTGRNVPSPDFVYSPERNKFIPPRPFESWILDETTLTWNSPIPYPSEGIYKWSEDEQTWILLA